jgi:transposase
MRDARSLSNDALEALRWRAVEMVRGGATQVATAKALGVHNNTVSLWLKWLRQGGGAALKPKRRGRRVGYTRRCVIREAASTTDHAG